MFPPALRRSAAHLRPLVVRRERRRGAPAHRPNAREDAAGRRGPERAQGPRAAQHRARDHGRPHRRPRRGGEHALRPSTWPPRPAGSGRRSTTAPRCEPVFDDQDVSSIGDVTIAPSDPADPLRRHRRAEQPPVVLVGQRRLQVARRRARRGPTWASRTRTTSAASSCTPSNPDVVYVAALGHLWGPNKERGLFTHDGRRARPGSTRSSSTRTPASWTWPWIPQSPQTLYAASYQRRRTPFGYNGGGPGSALWKTTDGGETWTKLASGLPTEGDVGRIGIAVYRRDPAHRVRAGGARHGRAGIYRSEDKGETWKKMSDTNPRPSYYSKLHVDPDNDQRVWVLGAPLFVLRGRRQDVPAATSVQKIHGDYHALWIDPADSEPHAGRHRRRHAPLLRPRRGRWDYVNTIPLAQFYEISLRHAEALPRVRRAAGQRQLVRPQPHALPAGHLERGLVRGSAAATASTT